MKIILVILTFPGNIQPGIEEHIPFDTFEQCEAAPDGVAFYEGGGGWKYCTTQMNETWRYENQKPDTDDRTGSR